MRVVVASGAPEPAVECTAYAGFAAVAARLALRRGVGGAIDCGADLGGRVALADLAGGFPWPDKGKLPGAGCCGLSETHRWSSDARRTLVVRALPGGGVD